MARMRVICPACKGVGNLPADESKKSAYGAARAGPHICDNCGGEGKVWGDVVVEETKPSSLSGFTLEQMDACKWLMSQNNYGHFTIEDWCKQYAKNFLEDFDFIWIKGVK